MRNHDNQFSERPSQSDTSAPASTRVPPTVADLADELRALSGRIDELQAAQAEILLRLSISHDGPTSQPSLLDSHDLRNSKIEATPAEVAMSEVARHVCRIADHLDPSPVNGMVGTKYIAIKIGRSQRRVAQLAAEGKIPSECVADWGGDGRIWKFQRPKIDRWIAHFLGKPNERD
jgi:hypothetical protein